MMDISTHIKPDAYLVIELKDEVEYLLDDASIRAMQAGEESVPLVRLVDRETRLVDRADIEDAFAEREGGGPVDYLKKV